MTAENEKKCHFSLNFLCKFFFTKIFLFYGLTRALKNQGRCVATHSLLCYNKINENRLKTHMTSERKRQLTVKKGGFNFDLQRFLRFEIIRVGYGLHATAAQR